MSERNLAAELKRIVGEENVLTDPTSRMEYSKDMAEYEGYPSSIVKPASESEVIRVVRLADRTKSPIVARGAGSSLTGAAVLEGGIVLDMRRMNRVIKVDATNWYVQVQPGISLDDLNIELRRHGFFFPPDPASSYICTVGGAIAEGSGGLRCVKYGTMKDWVISARVVLANGEVARFGEPLPKNRAGYDLLHLLVGSEGTLGIITEAHLRIIPLPATTPRRLLLALESWDSVGKVITMLRRSAIVPGLLEFLDRQHAQAINAKLGHNLEESEATLIVDIDEPDLNEAVAIFKACGAKEIRIAKDEEEADNLYQIRAMALLAVKSLAPASQVEDVTVPLDRLEEFLTLLRQVAIRHKLRIPVMGHAGDGNIHPIILYDSDSATSKESASKAFEEICRDAIRMDGSVSGEHGIGTQKIKLFREQLELHEGKEALRLMKEIKRIFDPKGIMNPGKYVEAA